MIEVKWAAREKKCNAIEDRQTDSPTNMECDQEGTRIPDQSLPAWTCRVFTLVIYAKDVGQVCKLIISPPSTSIEENRNCSLG